MDERLIDRAVTIWQRLLSNPRYQAVCDKSGDEDKRTMGIASKLAYLTPSNATPELLDKFGEALRRRLIEECKKHEYVCLSVDYGPDKILQEAKDEVGLEMEFPWKTVMHLLNGHLDVSEGYGTEYLHHYPLIDGRWLLTTLHGSDIAKVVALVEQGITDVFTVEVDVPTVVPLQVRD